MPASQIADGELITQIRETIASTLQKPLEIVGPQAEQDDVEGWDSLGQLNIIMELEERFGVSFTTEQVIQMRSVPQIATTIETIKKS